MKIPCPGCKQVLTAPDDAAGRKAVCAKCRTSFVIAATPANPSAVGKPCPNCGKTLSADAIICFGCGYNFQAGRIVPPDEPEPTEEKDESPSLHERAAGVVGAWAPGLLRPGLTILAIVLTVIGFGVMALCVVMVMLGAVLEACMVGGFGLILYGQALAMMLTGESGLLHELLADFSGRQWLVFFVLLFMPFLVLYFLVQPFIPHG